MNDFLSRLDAADGSDVPVLCLLLADWLSERGDPEAEGWMALGRLGKVPERYKDTEFDIWHHWFWAERSGVDFMTQSESRIPSAWFKAMGAMRGAAGSRSLALRAAAIAFVGLGDEVKREILRDRTIDLRGVDLSDCKPISPAPSPEHVQMAEELNWMR